MVTHRLPPHFWAVLMLGVISQIGQVLLLREFLVVFHGSELSIGLILAAWLAWVGVGSHLGFVILNRCSRPLFLLVLNSVGILVVLPGTIFVIRILRGFFDVLPGAYLSLADMAASCFLLTAPACLLLGIQFVLLARIWREKDRVRDTSGAGKTYVGEAVGNMLGGILFALLIVHYWNSFQTAVAAAVVLVAAALWAAARFKGGARLRRWALPVLLVLLVPAFPLLEHLDERAYKMQWQHFVPEHQLIETHQSKHGTISVAEREGQYSFFQSGHLLFSTAGPEVIAPMLEEQDAVEFAHLTMVQHQEPERVLLIGGGLRGTLGEILEHPVKRVDYIELDEVLTEAARPYVSPSTMEALEDQRVNLIHADGRLFIKGTEEKYDMIIIDAPDPSTADMNRFYTQEFFSEAEELLHSDGVLALSAVSTPDLRGTAIANRNATIYHTLKDVFPSVLPAGERVMYYFASQEPQQISIDPHLLEERYLERDIEAEGFSGRHFHVILEETQLERVNWVVRNHGRTSGAHLEGPERVPITPGTIAEQEAEEKELPPVVERYFLNSDFQPIAYYYTIMTWDEHARESHRVILDWLLTVEPWWVLPVVVVPLTAAVGLRMVSSGSTKRRRLGTAFGVLFAVFATGVATMALQIALIFSFQSIYGFVYELVGVIIALFMCGLALGAFVTHYGAANKANLTALTGVQGMIALLACLVAFLLPASAAVQSPAAVFALFSLLTLAAGAVNGVGFPLAAACFMSLSRHAEKSTGMVYGIELFGACAGAAAASAVIAPVLGITACCFFAGIAGGTSFVVLLITRGNLHG